MVCLQSQPGRSTIKGRLDIQAAVDPGVIGHRSGLCVRQGAPTQAALPLCLGGSGPALGHECRCPGQVRSRQPGPTIKMMRATAVWDYRSRSDMTHCPGAARVGAARPFRVGPQVEEPGIEPASAPSVAEEPMRHPGEERGSLGRHCLGQRTPGCFSLARSTRRCSRSRQCTS